MQKALSRIQVLGFHCAALVHNIFHSFISFLFFRNRRFILHYLLCVRIYTVYSFRQGEQSVWRSVRVDQRSNSHTRPFSEPGFCLHCNHNQQLEPPSQYPASKDIYTCQTRSPHPCVCVCSSALSLMNHWTPLYTLKIHQPVFFFKSQRPCDWQTSYLSPVLCCQTHQYTLREVICIGFESVYECYPLHV